MLLRRPGAVDAVLPEQRLVDRVGAGKARRMRLRRRGADTGFADLAEHDRLAVRMGDPQGLDEFCSVSDAFVISHDHRDIVLPCKPGHAFGNVDIGLVAGRYPVAEPHVAGAAEIGQVAGIGVALADDRDRARLRQAVVEGAAEGADEACPGIEHAKAVGPEQLEAADARDRAQLLL
jgi:hypothetical protein